MAPTDTIDSLSTGVITLDSDLHINAMNSASEAMLSASKARLTGTNFLDLLKDADEVTPQIRAAVEAQTPVTQRSVTLQNNGHEPITADLTITPSRLEREGGLLIELHPVDRIMRISRGQNLLQTTETTHQIVRGLAHEVKNPLGGIRGAAQLLARELDDPNQLEYTQIIIREADRLRALVDRLLGPNKPLDWLPLNIHEVLEHVRRLLEVETDQNIRIERDYDPSLPEITGDRAQLIQAILNIALNAIQACHHLSECVITLRSRVLRQFTIGAIRHRLVCKIDIEDNGPGINEELMGLIFLPMVTGRAEGTGLGLSISQSIVNRHGGLLECQSKPGATIFSLYLPLELDHD
jgi:two-component system nitrogen regulation sensor histidine kinase GlnL